MHYSLAHFRVSALNLTCFWCLPDKVQVGSCGCFSLGFLFFECCQPCLVAGAQFAVVPAVDFLFAEAILSLQSSFSLSLTAGSAQSSRASDLAVLKRNPSHALWVRSRSFCRITFQFLGSQLHLSSGACCGLWADKLCSSV